VPAAQRPDFIRRRIVVFGGLAAVLVIGATVGMRADNDPAKVERAGVERAVVPSTTMASSATPTPLAPIGGLAPSLVMMPRRVYVPNGKSNTVSEIDPVTRTVIRTFKVGKEPQHIVPAYDLSRLWVLDNTSGDLVPIDPTTGDPGPPVKVADPYNLYFTPDGANAIVVAEKDKRLDFRDPNTMALRRSIDVPACDGINHIDYSGDGSYLIATCEFAGRLAKIDWRDGRVLNVIDLPHDPRDNSVAMPQDIRVGEDGHTFYVADMMRGGLYVLDGDTMAIEGFIPTGIGTHGITPSRDGTVLYVANRGSRGTDGQRHGRGSLSVVDVATRQVVANWPVPGGGSPDMGNLSTDGTELWLSGRFDSEVYVFDLVHGGLAARIPVGHGPHGLTYWPQPGHYSLGHTGNMR
jgi:YVTN family beta-propeller protein